MKRIELAPGSHRECGPDCCITGDSCFVDREDVVELTDREAKEIAAELRFSLEGGVPKGTLFAIYEQMFAALQEEGTCDHRVGLCFCEARNVLQIIAEKLGHQNPDPEKWDFSYPPPAELRELLRARKNAAVIAS